MKRPNPLWYYVALGLALVLPGVRVLTWAAPPIHTLEAEAVETGKTLFVHEWKAKDPLAKGGDGLGPVFNATSCVACHSQPSVGGASGREHNVTMYTRLPSVPAGQITQGVVHAAAVSPRFQETLQQVDPSLPPIAQPALVRTQSSGSGRPTFGFDFATPAHVVLSQRNTPALYGAKWIDELSDRVILAQEKKQQLHAGLAPANSENLPVGRAVRLPGGRIGKFGWKGQSASLLEFVQAACANELGLGNPAQAQPSPIGRREFAAVGLDLTDEQCRQMTDFVCALPRPAEKAPADAALRGRAESGKRLFATIGCVDCHTPNMGSIDGLYSDLLMHRMGSDLQGGGIGYNGARLPDPNDLGSGMPRADEWRTPPLWGVADSAPYLHDGRADSLEEAIQLHGGQGLKSANAYARLPALQQADVIAFLKTLRAP